MNIPLLSSLVVELPCHGAPSWWSSLVVELPCHEAPLSWSSLVVKLPCRGAPLRWSSLVVGAPSWWSSLVVELPCHGAPSSWSSFTELLCGAPSCSFFIIKFHLLKAISYLHNKSDFSSIAISIKGLIATPACANPLTQACPKSGPRPNFDWPVA